MYSLTRQLIFSLLIVQMGCSGPAKPDPTLEKAFQIHQRALETAEETRGILQEISSNNEHVSEIESRLREWDENLIEVPGFEHEHGHGHDHHHDHARRPQVDLSPKDMLAVQQQLLDTILAIKTDLLEKHGDDFQ